MKIAFHYPARCLSTPIDPTRLESNERGLTGSENSFLRYGFELHRRGHDVQIYTGVTVENELVRHESKMDLRGADSVVSWMVPDACEQAEPTTFRVYNQQCSDFAMCRPNWERTVDLFCPLSRSHARHMSTQTELDRKCFSVMHNGVDLDEFKPLEKVPGKVVWASSHDRGLHHLLGLWPHVKERVPHAELHVFYDPSGLKAFAEQPERSDLPKWCNELYRRSLYSLHALERLQRCGVVLHGSVSRERIRVELGTAEVLAYPCEPVRYTETFGVTVLEAMASGCVPVLCLSDAFGELWGEVAPAVQPPFIPARDTYAELLVNVLTKPKMRASVAKACRLYAERFAWHVLADRFETTLETRGQSGLEKMIW